jgi:hypothetical protein
VLASLAYFLNLEDVLKFMELPNYGTLIFNRDFISILFLITLLYLFINLYTVTNKKLTYETKI